MSMRPQRNEVPRDVDLASVGEQPHPRAPARRLSLESEDLGDHGERQLLADFEEKSDPLKLAAETIAVDSDTLTLGHEGQFITQIRHQRENLDVDENQRDTQSQAPRGHSALQQHGII